MTATTTTPGRRTLRYADFAAINDDVARLLAAPHRTVGRWSLAQICEHLAAVTRSLVDLPASTPFDPSKACTPEQKRQIFESGQLPEGIPLPPNREAPASPPESAPDQAEALRAALEHFAASPTGPVIKHRVFGPLDRDEWDRLVRIHAAHHLSFVVPEA